MQQVLSWDCMYCESRVQTSEWIAVQGFVNQIDLSGRPEGGMITCHLKEAQAKAVVNEYQDDPAPDIVKGMLYISTYYSCMNYEWSDLLYSPLKGNNGRWQPILHLNNALHGPQK